jgi:hypothetical protein
LVIASSLPKKLGAQSLIADRKRDREFAGPINVRRTKTTVIDFVTGMIVCVPFKDDVTGADSFWLAKVLSSDDAEVTLIDLAPTENSGQYRANLRSVWREPVTACHLCDVNYDDTSNVYTLRTPPAEITALLNE